MNDEIKEILDKLSNRKQETLIQGIRECQLKNIDHPFITKEEYIDKVLDYITTLQEENERLNKIIKLRIGEHNTIYSYMQDYKSRNEKAIKCIKENIYNDDFGLSVIINPDFIKDLLNILQGDDK